MGWGWEEQGGTGSSNSSTRISWTRRHTASSSNCAPPPGPACQPASLSARQPATAVANSSSAFVAIALLASQLRLRERPPNNMPAASSSSRRAPGTSPSGSRRQRTTAQCDSMVAAIGKNSMPLAHTSKQKQQQQDVGQWSFRHRAGFQADG